MAHFLLQYLLSPDYFAARGAHAEAHIALITDAAAKGDLVISGVAGDPVDVAMLVFADEAAAHAFAAADPYVSAGLVSEWSVRPWFSVVGTADALIKSA